jgi:hypothetical protein
MVAFEGWPCYWFEPIDGAPARGWLRADVSIECSTPELDSVQMLAWAAVIVYPIGFWLGCLVLLWSASTAIVSGEPTPFSRCVSFLFLEYKTAAYWWELMEMMRKFILIGLMVIVTRGCILQIAIATVVNAAYLVSARRSASYSRWLLPPLQSAKRFLAPRSADVTGAGATVHEEL